MGNTKGFLLVLGTILVLSIAYYFVIALPSSEKARLDFERQKYEEQKKEKREKEEKEKVEAESRETQFQLCVDSAEQEYWNYVKLNGKPVPGKLSTYTAPMYVWNEAEKKKKESLAECHRRYKSK